MIILTWSVGFKQFVAGSSQASFWTFCLKRQFSPWWTGTFIQSEDSALRCWLWFQSLTDQPHRTQRLVLKVLERTTRWSKEHWLPCYNAVLFSPGTHVNGTWHAPPTQTQLKTKYIHSWKLYSQMAVVPQGLWRRGWPGLQISQIPIWLSVSDVQH